MGCGGSQNKRNLKQPEVIKGIEPPDVDPQQITKYASKNYKVMIVHQDSDVVRYYETSEDKFGECIMPYENPGDLNIREMRGRVKFITPWAAMLAEVGDLLYIIGGARRPIYPMMQKQFDPTYSTYSFSFANKWLKKLKDLGESRYFCGCCSFEKYIYVMGGAPNRTTCEIYNTEKDKWKFLPDLNKQKQQVRAIPVMKSGIPFIYLIGGCTKLGANVFETLNEIEILNVNEKKMWELLSITFGEDSRLIQEVGAIQISDNEIFIFGGKGESGSFSPETFLFNMETRELSLLNKKLEFRDQFNSTLVKLYDNKIMSFGTDRKGIHQYDLIEKKWIYKSGEFSIFVGYES